MIILIYILPLGFKPNVLLIIIVKSHKQVLIKTILQDLLKDKTYLSFL